MDSKKIKMKIFLTNWVSVVGIFIVLCLTGVITELWKVESIGEALNAIATGLFGVLLALLLYSLVIWVAFILVMFLLDFILMNNNETSVRYKLLFEWLLVSSPFIYWAFKYSQWIFLVVIVTFFITQAIREKLILKLLSGTASSNQSSV